MISYRRDDDSLTGKEPTLSERQAANYLGVPLDEVRHAVNLGDLKCHGIRAKRRFVQRDLDLWQSQQAAKKNKQRRKAG